MGMTSDVSQKSNIKLDFRGCFGCLPGDRRGNICRENPQSQIGSELGLGAFMGISVQVRTLDSAVCGADLTPFWRDTALKDGRYRPGRMVQQVKVVAMKSDSLPPSPELT